MKTPKHPRDYEPDELLLLAMIEAFKWAERDHREIADCTYFDNSIGWLFPWSFSDQGFEFWNNAAKENLVPTYNTK